MRMDAPARSRRLVLASALGLALGACSSLRPPSTAQAAWSGRLSLAVRTEPAQNFSAGFELRGNARLGELMLNTPLGTTLAQASWTPRGAQLHSAQQVRSFASMEELTEQLTGAALPLNALFDWLQGLPAEVPGWQADLSQHAQGRLSARRSSPAPLVELRLILDR